MPICPNTKTMSQSKQKMTMCIATLLSEDSSVQKFCNQVKIQIDFYLRPVFQGGDDIRKVACCTAQQQAQHRLFSSRQDIFSSWNWAPTCSAGWLHYRPRGIAVNPKPAPNTRNAQIISPRFATLTYEISDNLPTPSPPPPPPAHSKGSRPSHTDGSYRR